MRPAIVVQNLQKEFRSGSVTTVAVDHVAFTLQYGEILAFLGHNGAGKTTTIKMLCGLITPTSGSILIGMNDMRSRARRGMLSLGTVLEGSRNIYWRLTVAENLEYFASSRGGNTPAFRQRAEQLLTKLGLADKRKAIVQTLSRGMQQKVALACALCTNPPILLLDEPTLGLDLQSSFALQHEIQRLAYEEGKAILLTTHQMEIASLANRIAIMNHGRIVALDAVKNLLGSFRVNLYEIRLQGAIPPNCRALLQERWDAEILEGEFETVLHISCEKAHNLHTIVEALERYSVTVLSLQHVEPSLSQVYVDILEGSSRETAATRA